MTGRRQPQLTRDLNIINTALNELKENNILPTERTKTNYPDGKSWESERNRLKRHENSSLARFFRDTGLKSTEAAWQTKLSAEEFEAAGDSLNEGLDGQHSISLLLEGHPVEKAQRAL